VVYIDKVVKVILYCSERIRTRIWY